ncbi:TMV resistance protein N-like isoform X2 [Rhodamnia argentea]|uniref:TMV resistance protein N-like isoform X2 n=1 Tax=Rhodamnia argentea TaxID=178133 RepID=A0A8B8QNM7_9MYRT|nr:TMV resistance protein N-like isoform X2 [Rhodamnia argentea]
MSSSSSSSEAKWPFDVFLSFRGPDVRLGFLAHLHRALLHRGINAYIDSEDLRPGDEISPALEKAIEESRIAVLVFSENYASSGWCLEELAKVMECKRLKGLLVLPVFYGVEPREIRGQRESYGKALARHEEKLGKDSEKVKKWRQALIEAANLSGWHYVDGDETKFIESIVKRISAIVGRVPLSVAKYPVGVGCRVEEVTLLLSMGSNDVRMIGIWGTGGIGKTTIAKAVYNSIASQFDGCSFLPNVRETSSKPDGLVHLQKTLLSETLWKENLVVFSVDGGANLIRDRLCCRKILLVLDDVDHENQLNALAREREWFGRGSRIIITSRDKHVLTSHGIDQAYEVKPLDRGEAFELLSSYAFPRDQTEDISRDLIDNILGYANGLPLAVVVLGPFLCGRSRAEWESTLGKLAESPNKDINSVLKISFDALEDNEKDIFLDIACFFKGFLRDYVTRVLDCCGLKALIGIQILIERSLLTIENEIRVQMHDLIQLMGQDIVKQECPDDPGKRSRLWCYDDVYEVLSQDTGTNAVKGIMLLLPRQEELDISPSAFTHMRRLKLLIFRTAQLSGGPICLPNDLRWLEWPECPLSTLKFSAGPKKLVQLDVFNSQIKQLEGNLKGLKTLKFIDFHECKSLVYMPDLSGTPNLEMLDLHECENLERGPESVAYLCKLWFLNLRGCSKLQNFPDIPDKNESLREVYLDRTSFEELPPSIENLVSLKKMTLRDCKKLAILPSCIYRLQNLEELDLNGCSKLKKFPKEEDSSDPHTKTGFPMLLRLHLAWCNLSEVEFLENLSCFPCLQSLDLSGNNFTNLPICGQLWNLWFLDVSKCEQLQEIPYFPVKLTHVDASGCKSLSKIPSEMGNVKFIQLYACHELVPNGFSLNDWFKPEKLHHKINCQVILPGGEMPAWLLPNKEGYVSFVASKGFYEKILGVALCFVIRAEGMRSCQFEFTASVNGKCTESPMAARSFDLEHVWLLFMDPKNVWTVDDFGPNDLSHFHLSIRVSRNQNIYGDRRGIVKQFGFRLICKPRENDLEISREDNPTSTKGESSNETKDVQDGETCTEEGGLNIADFSKEKHRYSSLWPYHRNVRPGREMPEEFVLVEDGTISFMASQEFYDKFLGLALCVVFDVEDEKKEVSFDIVPHVHGQRRNGLAGSLGSFDSDHTWFQFLQPNVLWGVLEGAVDFGEFEESYVRFSLTIRVLGGTMKKLGYLLSCKPLEDDLKIALKDDHSLDPASLCEDFDSASDTSWGLCSFEYLRKFHIFPPEVSSGETG